MATWGPEVPGCGASTRSCGRRWSLGAAPPGTCASETTLNGRRCDLAPPSEEGRIDNGGDAGVREHGGTGVQPILFLDFEASSLSPDRSWPVEIGWSVLREGEIVTSAMLIRPRASWTEWSEASAAIHGIPRADLDAAPDADLVAAKTDGFRDYQVVSDNPAWEQLWLDRLREGRSKIFVGDLHLVAAERLSPRGLDWMYERLARRKPPHRAGPDSRRLADAFIYGARRG
jgi:DNA polymerase III subunit epsilon